MIYICRGILFGNKDPLGFFKLCFCRNHLCTAVSRSVSNERISLCEEELNKNGVKISIRCKTLKIETAIGKPRPPTTPATLAHCVCFNMST